jgi:hypothetical protein
MTTQPKRPTRRSVWLAQLLLYVFLKASLKYLPPPTPPRIAQATGCVIPFRVALLSLSIVDRPPSSID